MKLSLFLILSVATSIAFACPDLSGTYSCDIEGEEEHTLLTIKQSINHSGHTVFEQIWMSPSSEAPTVKTVTADGKLITTNYDEEYEIIESYACTYTELMNENLNIYKNEKIDRIEKVNQRWFQKNNKDLAIETSFKLMGTHHKPDISIQVCKRQ